MEEFLKSVLLDTQGAVAYAAIFGVLVACGLGVPLPEDISLILGGYLAHLGAVHLVTMMAVGVGGILAGDTLIFFAGRRMGNRLSGGKGGFFARIVTPEKRAKVEALFAKHGEKIVMIARFLPGVRAVTYFTAGSSGMKYSHFIFWDGLAALASGPAFVYLGYRFGSNLEALLGKLKEGQYAVLGTLVAAGVAWFVYSRIRAKKQKADAAKALAEKTPVDRLPQPPPDRVELPD